MQKLLWHLFGQLFETFGLLFYSNIWSHFGGDRNMKEGQSKIERKNANVSSEKVDHILGTSNLSLPGLVLDSSMTFFVFCVTSIQCDQIGQFIAIWELFRACGNNYFAQIGHILGNFCKGVEIHFSSEIIFGQLLKKFGNL